MPAPLARVRMLGGPEGSHDKDFRVFVLVLRTWWHLHVSSEWETQLGWKALVFAGKIEGRL